MFDKILKVVGIVLILVVACAPGALIVDAATGNDVVVDHVTFDEIEIVDGNTFTVDGLTVDLAKAQAQTLGLVMGLGEYSPDASDVHMTIIHHTSWVDDSYDVEFK